jgi:hypothetical protein
VRTASENPKRDVPEKGSGPVPVGFFRDNANGTFPRPRHFPRAPLGEKLEARVGIGQGNPKNTFKIPSIYGPFNHLPEDSNKYNPINRY